VKLDPKCDNMTAGHSAKNTSRLLLPPSPQLVARASHFAHRQLSWRVLRRADAPIR
jgi:hypothetical protein